MMTYVLIVLLTTVVRYSLGCFPMLDVFQHSTRWMQITSMNSRRMVEVGEETDEIMIIETTETIGTEEVIKHREQLLCMMEYGEHRYLVRIDDDEEGSRYMCYQFTPLTEYIVRQGRTEENINRKRVNCIDDQYTEDEQVLIAYSAIQPQQCPLAGGYQLIMQQGMAVDRLCINSIKTYNPYIHCQPMALNPYMRGRHLTHLRCVGQWEDNDFHSVLLQTRDNPHHFWCLHYKVVSWGKSGGKNNDQEELVKVFLTIDGRCSSQTFGNEDVPRNTSMFGHLALYKPINDIKCTETVYVESCKLDEDKCLESIECPKSCGRCLNQVESYNCTFPAETFGSWKVFNSDRNLEMTIDKDRIESSSFGELMCLGVPEPRRQGYLYTVVQINAAPTCNYYYSCAEMFNPNPGVLTFQLRPAFRNSNTGELVSCKESYQDSPVHVRPPEPEAGFTLINQQRLQRTSCNFLQSSKYRTKIPGCSIVVHECSGPCQIFNVTFDIPSCDNETQQIYNIENQHICHAKVDFYDGVYGIVTKGVTSGKFLCWVFGNSQLFVPTAEDCNLDSMDRIYSDASADTRYDLLKAISLNPPQDNSAEAVILPVPSALMFSLLVTYMLEVAFVACYYR
ncbi:unnamed protein product [Candidula unifasciata]|uniref:Uncharacterized protein n=1 Tax=Candidula unifasciata TaxID=100452 RepID=A0A8S3YDM9_9EUPU|nr:unnamed protein product [Candidula unifasciata]